MTADTSILSFMLNAGFVVKIVMLILILASVMSWMMIIQRYWLFRRTNRHMQKFYKHFQATPNLAELNSQYTQVDQNSPMQMIFKTAFNEYKKNKAHNQTHEDKLNAIDRAIHIIEQRQLMHLEQNLGLLATIGSVSPYIGLFGTVWGIMTSFTALGGVQQATIAMVAPGISEALIATAFGLFAAIPAVIAYNRFTIKLNTLENHHAIFKQELLALFDQLLNYSN